MRQAFFAALILAAAVAGGQEPLFRSGEPLRFPLGVEPGPGKLVVADLSGDSRGDLAVLAAEVVVYITGVPAAVPDLARTSYPVAPPSPLFLAGDLDGDAHTDLLAGSAAAVQILRNTGGGSFESAAFAPVDATPRAGKLVDLDEDGFLDLIVVKQAAPQAVASLGILIADAKGGFLPEVSRTLGQDVVADSFAAEDFGGDGLLDIALAIGGAEPRIRVLPGDGGTAFGEPIDTSIAASPRHIVSNYVNDDDRADLVVLGGEPFESSRFFYLENKGIDEFIPVPVAETDPPPVLARELFSVLDFDEDGIVDVVTQFDMLDGVQGLRVQSGNGTGSFPASANRFLWDRVLDYALLDLSGEGIRDLVALEAGDLAIYLGLDPGRLNIPNILPLDSDVLFAAALDWSEDGKLDLVARGPTVLHLLRGDGTGGFENALRREDSPILENMVIGDFDGDTRLEPAFGRLRDQITIFLLDPQGAIASTRDITVDGMLSGIAAANFDGDGRTDLVVSSRDTSDAQVILDPLGDQRRLFIDAGAPQTSLDTGDVNGDGSHDIVFATTSGLRIVLGDGNGAFLEAKDLSLLARSSSVRVEEGLGGTPKGIVGVRDGGAILVWIQDPLGAAEPLEIADGTRPVKARALDIDGDSIPDLLSTRNEPVAFQTRLGLAGGGFGSPETYATGLASGSFNLADLDADGLTDVVAANPYAQALVILAGHLGQKASAASFRRGDADSDGSAAITDAIVVLNWLFQGGPEPGCQDAADSDDSGVIDLTDPIRVLDFLFRGGPEPPDPGSAQCGEDPTADELATCAAGCS